MEDTEFDEFLSILNSKLNTDLELLYKTKGLNHKYLDFNPYTGLYTVYAEVEGEVITDITISLPRDAFKLYQLIEL